MSTTSCLTIASTEFEELGARLETRLAGPRPNRMQARPHIGVLGVGDDEIRTPIGAAANARELVVESNHERLSGLDAGFTGRPPQMATGLSGSLAPVVSCR